MDFNRYGLLAAVLLMGGIAGAHADDNPGYDRPGLGFTPAVLKVGDLTWEQGLPDASRQDGSTLYNADTLLRFGLGKNLELQAGSSWNWLRADGYRSQGRGSSSLGLKFALPASGAFSWGLLGSVTFSDGARDFRADPRQYLAGAAFNWQLDARNSAALYVQDVRAGGKDSTLLAINDGYAFSPAFSIYAEAAWQHDASQGDGSQVGAGLAWLPTPRVQLDASFRRRLAGHADSWDAGLGLAVYFGR